MGHQVFSEELVASVVKELQIADLAHATIGEIKCSMYAIRQGYFRKLLVTQ